MKINGTRIALAFVIVFLIFGALTLLFWTTIRDTIIVPIYYFVWVSGLMINSLSQQVFVVALAVILFLIGLNTLLNVRLRASDRGGSQRRTPPDTRYQHWQRLYANVYASRFSRNLFYSDSRRLILNILAYEYAIKPFEAEARLKSGVIPVPDGIRELFHQRDTLDAPQDAIPTQTQAALSSARRLIGQAAQERDPQVERMINEVIAFVEYHVETSYAGNTGQA